MTERSNPDLHSPVAIWVAYFEPQPLMETLGLPCALNAVGG
jgi:hypothetical protein